MTDQSLSAVGIGENDDGLYRELPSPQDHLIEAATDLFHAEYTRCAQPIVRGMDEAEHDDCVRAALEAVIVLVQEVQCVADGWGAEETQKALAAVLRSRARQARLA